MKRSREPDDEVSGYRTSSLGDDAAIDHNSSSAICSRESSSAAAPPPAVKIVQLDPESSRAQEQLSAVPPSVMKCSLPPHKEGLSFPSYEEYEAHYHKAHTNRCLECRKNFPSEHLLVVHIEECHDSLAAVRRERGEHTYSCFVESCERKCLTPQKRRLHMIDKHGYPRNYFFALTKEGIDGRRSLLLEGGHRRRSSSNVQLSPRAPKGARRRSSILETPEASVAGNTTQPTAPTGKGKEVGARVKTDEKGGERPDAEMEDLAGAMSSLQFVPTSVRFGRGGRAGFANKK